MLRVGSLRFRFCAETLQVPIRACTPCVPQSYFADAPAAMSWRPSEKG